MLEQLQRAIFADFSSSRNHLSFDFTFTKLIRGYIAEVLFNKCERTQIGVPAILFQFINCCDSIWKSTDDGTPFELFLKEAGSWGNWVIGSN
jgi:hypothetical protein